jgi:hypothetical protein
VHFDALSVSTPPFLCGVLVDGQVRVAVVLHSVLGLLLVLFVVINAAAEFGKHESQVSEGFT